MKSANAIRTYFNSWPGNNPEMTYLPISVSEIKEFKESMTQVEYLALARQACEAMGEVHEI